MSDKSTRPFLSIVIPAYNEERRLPATLDRITSYLGSLPYPSEVLVVDDGSQDNTVALVDSFCKSHAEVRLVRNDHRGKGFAVRTGMLAARGHIVLFCDADLSTPIEELEQLLPWFDRGYEIVIASREGMGALRVKEPFYRHAMGRAFNLLVRMLTVRGIQDTQCGFKAFRDDAAQKVFGRMLLYGAKAQRVSGAMVTAFDVEALFLGAKMGYRIKEVPTKWIYSEESRVNPLRDSWRNLRDVVTVRWNEARGRYESPNGLEK
jgi:glycosyltransferase involved in cell wall biosynthesis